MGIGISGGIHSLAIHLRCSYFVRMNESNPLGKKPMKSTETPSVVRVRTSSLAAVEIRRADWLRR